MNKKEKAKPLDLLLQARIESKIFLIHGKRVMLDSDLAKLYEVPTKRLNEQVRRNTKRFPEDFMFQLNAKEFKNMASDFGIPSLRSQIATSKKGGRRYLPYVFTEQGVAMLSSVLNSEKAIEVNIFIMRVFVKIREVLLTHKDLREKVEAMEKAYKKDVAKIFFLINWMLEDKKSKNKIGFKLNKS